MIKNRLYLVFAALLMTGLVQCKRGATGVDKRRASGVKRAPALNVPGVMRRPLRPVRQLPTAKTRRSSQVVNYQAPRTLVLGAVPSVKGGRARTLSPIPPVKGKKPAGRKLGHGPWLISWNKKEITARKRDGRPRVICRAYKKSSSGMSEERKCRILSVVGTLISYQLDYYHEGGAHPSYGSYYKTVDLERGKKPITLTMLFPEKDVVKALKGDRVIKKALSKERGRGKGIGTLKSLLAHIDGGCKMSFLSIPSSFAFHHVKGGEVALRIGLPHGCEVMRGTFTQLGLYLPIPKALKGSLARAVWEKSLMKNLVR